MCRVIGVDPVAQRRALAETCGIAWTVGGDPESAIDEIRKITGGTGANITVDAVGHSAVALQAVRATADHGQHIVLGSPRVPVEGNLTDIFRAIHTRWITMRGALEWCIPMYPAIGQPVSQLSKQQMIFDWIGRSHLQLEPLISHTLKPAQIKQAYEGLLHQPELFTGVLLDWRN